MTRTDLAFDEKRRKLVASCAALWTILGAAIAIALTGFSSVNRDARPFIIGSILVAALAGVGASIVALRGMRRLTILFLLLSVIYPTYFFWIFNVIPLALVGYLLFLPYLPSLRSPSVNRMKIRFLSLFTIAVMATVAWFSFHMESMRSAEFKRVQYAFRQMSLAVAKNEEVVSLELAPVHVGIASYPDGTKASLWVTNPAPLGIRRGCFYIDEQRKSGVFEYGASGYGEFACVIPGKQVTLDRQGSIVIGYVGLWPARTVSVTANGTSTKLPVTLGYFILPGSLSVDPASKFTITLMSKGGVSLGTVTDLKHQRGSAASMNR